MPTCGPRTISEDRGYSKAITNIHSLAVSLASPSSASFSNFFSVIIFGINKRQFRMRRFITVLVIIGYTVAGRSQCPRDRRRRSAATRCDCGFEFRRGHVCLSVMSFLCCQVEVSASGSHTVCGVRN